MIYEELRASSPVVPSGVEVVEVEEVPSSL
jgi:hypothetical protein